jgi:hypothetical protein
MCISEFFVSQGIHCVYNDIGFNEIVGLTIIFIIIKLYYIETHSKVQN